MDLNQLLGLTKKEPKQVVQMYLEKKKICPSYTLFDVPHLPEPMTAKQIVKKFPKFAKEMNGSSSDATLLYFYSWNKERKVYEFQDPDAEEEVAELLGVNILDETKELPPTHEIRPLTEEEHQLFREHIQDIRETLAKNI